MPDAVSTAGQTQILRMVERGGGPNALGCPRWRPRRPSVDRSVNWWPCPGMAGASSGDDTLVSKPLARVAGTLASTLAQQSPAERTGDCSEPSCRHSFVTASGPHQALHRALASGPAARVRTVRKTEARNIQGCRQLRIARTRPTDAGITVQLTAVVVSILTLAADRARSFSAELLKIPQQITPSSGCSALAPAAFTGASSSSGR